MTTIIKISGRAGLDIDPNEILEAVQESTGGIAILVDSENDSEAHASKYIPIYEALAAHSSEIRVHIASGLAACTGVLGMAAGRFTMAPDATLRLLGGFAETYAAKSGLSDSQIHGLVFSTTACLSAKQAVELGLADEVTEDPGIKSFKPKRSTKTTFAQRKRNMAKAMTPHGATAKFNRLVQQKMAKGMSRAKAAADTARRNPRLHSLMLLETNAKASKHVKNAIRAHGGLAQKR